MNQANYIKESIDALTDTDANRFSREMHTARYGWAVHRLQNQYRGIGLILDAACGKGYGTKILSKVSKVIGTDINPEYLEYAMNKYGNENVSFLQANLESEESMRKFRDCSIDVIVSFETLEHCQNPGKVLINFYQVLKEAGILLLSTPNGLYERKDGNGKPYNVHHVHSYTPNELRKLVSNAGFSEIQMYGQGPIYGFLMGYLRKLLNLMEKGEKIVDTGQIEDAGTNQRSKSYRNLTSLRDKFIDLTGIVGIFTKPRSELIFTADNLIVEAKK